MIPKATEIRLDPQTRSTLEGWERSAFIEMAMMGHIVEGISKKVFEIAPELKDLLQRRIAPRWGSRRSPAVSCQMVLLSFSLCQSWVIC
jgi:hypothetical protein